jgi:hypothetical protein
MKKWCHALFWSGMKIELQPNETPGWKWHCLVYIEWLPRATHTWLSTQDLCGCFHLGVHLWMATQEQRDYHVFLALVSFQCNVMTLWALSWLSMMWGFNLFAWHRWYLGTGLSSMVEFSFWKVLSHSSLWVEWLLRWKCTTPAGCQTYWLVVSPVMDNLSS